MFNLFKVESSIWVYSIGSLSFLRWKTGRQGLRGKGWKGAGQHSFKSLFSLFLRVKIFLTSFSFHVKREFVSQDKIRDSRSVYA